MKFIRRPENNNPLFKNGSVATIGIFDGIHLGHQALINEFWGSQIAPTNVNKT